MVRRINEKVWVWSLVTGCLLWSIFYALSYVGPFSTRYFSASIFLGGPPTVTPSMVASEFTSNLSRAYSHWNWTEAILIVIALLLYFFVGWWTARRTGSVKTGFLAGLWAGLFYGLLTFVISVVQTIQLILSYSSTSHDSYAAQMKAYTTALILTDDASAFLLSFVLFGLLTGILGGICGGLLGRRFRVPPRTSLLQPQGA